ncbi:MULTISPECIES: hypothetical protein [Pseudoalteromonas]|nr:MULTISPECIES: hypothetical protein [Pseudoalteromonas]
MKLKLKKKAVKSLSAKENKLPKDVTNHVAGGVSYSLWTAFCEPD